MSNAVIACRQCGYPTTGALGESNLCPLCAADNLKGGPMICKKCHKTCQPIGATLRGVQLVACPSCGQVYTPDLIKLPKGMPAISITRGRAVAARQLSFEKEKEQGDNMENLKFSEVTSDGKKLMYVEFTTDGKIVRWYPKWQDLAAILDYATIIESGFNKDKHTLFFDVICTEVIVKSMLRRLFKQGCPDYPQNDLEVTKLFHKLRDSLIPRISAENVIKTPRKSPSFGQKAQKLENQTVSKSKKVLRSKVKRSSLIVNNK